MQIQASGLYPHAPRFGARKPSRLAGILVGGLTLLGALAGSNVARPGDTFECRQPRQAEVAQAPEAEADALRQTEQLPETVPDWVLQARLLYIQTGQLDSFNMFLPRRADLQAQNRYHALVKYDGQVWMVSERATFSARDWTQPGAPVIPPDPATRLLIAARLVDSYGESGWLEQALDDGLIISINVASPLPNSYFDISRRTLEMSNTAIWQGLAEPHDGINTVDHEFLHFVDQSGQTDPHKLDGLLPGMTQAEKQRFVAEWNRLRELHYAKAVRHEFSIERDPETGLQYYAFSEMTEFTAVLMETYQESPQVVEQLSPAIYRIFTRLLE